MASHGNSEREDLEDASMSPRFTLGEFLLQWMVVFELFNSEYP